MPFCAQILDAALFLPGVSAPVTADFSWDPQADAVPGAKAVPAGLRRRLSPLGKAAAEALFSLDAFRNETKAQTEDDAWVFSSRWGDLDASVAQLRSLAGGEDLSPTAFATSVHNGIAGQLSIAAKHTGFVTAIAGGDAPFARGFETAAALLVDHPRVHFVLYDQGVVPEDPKRYAAAFTLAKLDPTPDGDRHWLLRLDVCSYMGIGRFVLGLFENVEVLGGEGFYSYIEGKRRRMAAGDG